MDAQDESGPSTAIGVVRAQQAGETEPSNNQPPSKASNKTPLPITLVFVDRPYSLPWNECKTWEGMKRLLSTLHRRESTRGIFFGYPEHTLLEPDFIARGELDLSGPDGVILPEFWESSIEPGMEIRLRPWMAYSHTESSQASFHTASSTHGTEIAGQEDITDRTPSPPAVRSENSSQEDDNSSGRSVHHDFSEAGERGTLHPACLETIDEVSEDMDEPPFRSAELGQGDPPFGSQSRRSTSSANSYYSASMFEPKAEPPLPEKEIPIVEDENNFTVVVDLRKQAPQIPVKAWPSPGQNEKRLWRLDVQAAEVTRGASGTGNGTICTRLVTRTGPPKDAPRENLDPDWHWLHIQREFLDYDEFMNLALNSPNIDSDRQKITWALLQEVKSRISNLPEGKFIESGTVIRFRGKRLQSKDKDHRQHCSAMFISFPYLEAYEPRKLDPMENNDLHPPRSLLNALYSWETTYDYPREQSYTRYLKDSARRFIRFPSIWALQIDEKYLITSATIPQDDIMKMCSIQEECITPTIRFVDDEGRVILRHTNEYSSLLELEQSVSYQLSLRNLMVEDADISRLFQIFSSEKQYIHDVRIVHEAHQSKLVVPGFQSPVEIHPTPFFCWRPDAKPSQPNGGNFDERSDANENNYLKLNVDRLIDQPLSEGKFPVVYKQIMPKDKDSIWAIPLVSSFAASSHYFNEPAAGSRWSLECHKAQNEVTFQKRDLMRRNFIALHSITQYLLGLFFPNQTPIPEPVGKVWGIFSSLGKSLHTGHRTNATQRQSWIIPDPSIMELAMEIPTQQRPLRSAPSRICRETHGYSYSSAEDAVQHLRRRHFRRSFEGPEIENVLANYVCSIDQAEFQRVLDYFNSIVMQCLETMQITSKIGKSILVNTQTRHNQADGRTKLSESFIECFRSIIMFLNTAKELAISGERDHANAARDPSPSPVGLDNYLSELSNIGRKVCGCFQSAKNEVSTVLKPSEIPEVEGVAFGPDIVLVRMIHKLTVGPLSSGGARVPDVYDDALFEMRYAARNNPRKRLIQEINTVEEELNALVAISIWQEDALNDFIAALESTGSQPRNLRRRHLQPFQEKLLEGTIQLIQKDQEAYELTRDQCNPLTQKIKQSTEINEEDHGKAIFVFTVVTTIFLPLSFVTSFLGMNTTDIRDTTYSQSLFWMIALPVTAVVMTIIMGVAYNSDRLKDTFSRFSRAPYHQDLQRFRSVQNQKGQTSQRHPDETDNFGSFFSVAPAFIPQEKEQSKKDDIEDPKEDEEDRWQKKPPKVPKPIYIKVHKDHLSIETLTWYGLPWEWDQNDPNYIIILREMDPRETDTLFEHTKRLRTVALSQERQEENPEYAWVRKRSKQRSHSRQQKIQDPHHP